MLYTLPLTKMFYTNSPPKYKTTLKPKTDLRLFLSNLSKLTYVEIW